jgi:DNA-binding IclR family transcriptional regulator
MAEAASQTLSRGLRALELLADAAGGLTIDQLAADLGLHRSIAYRIVRTLEHHHLVRRDGAGRVLLAARLAALARNVDRDLQSAALPVLTGIAHDLTMTAFVVVLDGDECVTLVSVEPPHSLGAVAQRPGTRHPLAIGAPGIAIQGLLTPAQWRGVATGERRPEAEAALARGWASSRDEVIPGLRSVSVGLPVPGGPPAALAVVYVASVHGEDAIGARLRVAAGEIAGELG